MKVSSKPARKNWTTAGSSIDQEDFKKEIKKAEKGPFYSLPESKKLLKQWRAQRAGQ